MEITELMIRDTLRYIQMPQSELDEELFKKIETTYKELESISAIKTVYKCFAIEIDQETISFKGTQLKMTSSDLAKLFANSSRCYILAVTLGQEVDRQISIKQKIDMLSALILDACASVLADIICDDIEKEILKELKENEFLTMRFSPGYGDTSLEVQEQIISVLEAAKKIGLGLTKTNMLVPTKSITALIGVSSQKQKAERSCKGCRLADKCAASAPLCGRNAKS